MLRFRQSTNRLLFLSSSSSRRCCFSNTSTQSLPMKPGTILKPLAVSKSQQEPPTVLERNEYPDWVNSLSTPLQSLAQLRKIPNEDAKEKEIMRYLKLTRRQRIRQSNLDKMN